MQVLPLLRSVVLAAALSAIAAGAQTLPLPGDAPNLRPSLPVEAYLDWGLGVVGNEVLTVGEVTREQMNPMSPWAARLREGEDPRAMQEEVIRDLAMTRLEIEAGRNRGFDPALVDSLVSDNFERRMELMGGPVAFSQQLSTSRLTPEQFREMMRGNLLRSSPAPRAGSSPTATSGPESCSAPTGSWPSRTTPRTWGWWAAPPPATASSA